MAHLCAVDTFIQVASANQERFSLSSALTPAHYWILRLRLRRTLLLQGEAQVAVAGDRE